MSRKDLKENKKIEGRLQSYITHHYIIWKSANLLFQSFEHHFRHLLGSESN